MEVGILNSKSAEVNGKKPKSLRYRRANNLTDSKRTEQGNSLLGSQFVYIVVFSDDFAAVDFREELCHHSLTEYGKISGDGRSRSRFIILAIYLNGIAVYDRLSFRTGSQNE